MIEKYLTGIFLTLLLYPSVLLAGEPKSIAGISFTAPDAWKETQPSSSMRAFQFEVPGEGDQKAELAVFYFGEGQGGDIQGNIDRWKAQFTELKDDQQSEKTISDAKIHQVLLEGTYQQSGGPMMAAVGEPLKEAALLGAIIEAPQGAVFLKMTGPGAVVKKAAPDFEALLNSLKKS